MRTTSPLRSSTDQSEPAPTQRLYGAPDPVGIRPVTRAVRASIRDTTPLESSAQTAPSPATTAIGSPASRTVWSRPDGSRLRTTRDCSLQATQAVPLLIASVCVGQYGPAPAQES